MILERVFNRLDTYEAATPKNRYASILRLRHDNPDASIEELVFVVSPEMSHLSPDFVARDPKFWGKKVAAAKPEAAKPAQ